jgi:hypothetical protein
MSSTSATSNHWFRGDSGSVYVDAIPGSTFCREMECVNCAGRRPKQEEERYIKAKKEALSLLINIIIEQCHYKRASGIKALSSMDEELHYLTPKTRIRATYYQPLESTIKSGDWDFSKRQLLLQKKEIVRVLQRYCSRGWFSLYVCEQDGKVCCNVTVSKGM